MKTTSNANSQTVVGLGSTALLGRFGLRKSSAKSVAALAIVSANTLLCFGTALVHGNGWWPAAANGVAAVFFAWRVAVAGTELRNPAPSWEIEEQIARHTQPSEMPNNRRAA